MQDEPLEPDPVIEAYKKDLDRTLIRQSLKLTIERRFREAMALARFANELRRAGREARVEPLPCGRPRDFDTIAELEALEEESRG
jgi:hypothetical protein